MTEQLIVNHLSTLALVLQNPEDEPASELLERVEAERARFVKEKQIKKQKPLPVLTEQEAPFELPTEFGVEYPSYSKYTAVKKGCCTVG